jgi:hypothetical protein
MVTMSGFQQLGESTQGAAAQAAYSPASTIAATATSAITDNPPTAEYMSRSDMQSPQGLLCSISL